MKKFTPCERSDLIFYNLKGDLYKNGGWETAYAFLEYTKEWEQNIKKGKRTKRSLHSSFPLLLSITGTLAFQVLVEGHRIPTSRGIDLLQKAQTQIRVDGSTTRAAEVPIDAETPASLIRRPSANIIFCFPIRVRRPCGSEQLEESVVGAAAEDLGSRVGPAGAISVLIRFTRGGGSG